MDDADRVDDVHPRRRIALVALGPLSKDGRFSADEPHSRRPKDQLAPEVNGTGSKGGCQRTRLRRLLAPEVDGLSRKGDDPAVAMAQPGITAQQRKRFESIRSDETVMLPISAPSYVVMNATDLIRTQITLVRAYADAVVGEGLDVEIRIGCARAGADLPSRLRERYLPTLRRRTTSHHQPAL